MAEFPFRSGNRERPLRDIIGDLGEDISSLVQQQVALAKAELRQSARRAVVGSALAVAVLAIVLIALFFLSLAAWWGLGLLVGNAWSGLILGGFWLIIAAVAALIAAKSFSGVRGAPRTVESLRNAAKTLSQTRIR